MDKKKVDMKRSKRYGSVLMATVWVSLFAEAPLKAQDELEVNLGADLVSGYVWRGVYQAGSGVSVQPSLELGYKGFSVGAWSSTGLQEGFKELDFSVGYSAGGFSVTVTDYWWAGQGVPYYSDYSSTHLLEGSVGYHFGKKCPLHLSWSTFFAGELDKDAAGKHRYSTYIEAGYDFSIQGVDLAFSVGIAPWDAPAWLAPRWDKKGFQVSCVSLKASKLLKITESYSLPIFVQLVGSPATDDANVVFGISF